jgi:hypothetical protein
MMRLYLILTIVGFFYFVQPVWADQSLVTFTVTPKSSVEVGEAYSIKAYVYSDATYQSYCKNCKVTIKLQDSQIGDDISQSSSVTDDQGNITAKVTSKSHGTRYLYAEVQLPSGTTISSSPYALSFVPQSPNLTTRSATITAQQKVFQAKVMTTPSATATPVTRPNSSPIPSQTQSDSPLYQLMETIQKFLQSIAQFFE